MVTQDDILGVLQTIDDPEMPISIVDLGIVERVRIEDGPAPNKAGPTGTPPAGDAAVVVDILPTFIGCPALPILEREITEKVGRMEGVGEVRIRFVFDPPWSVDRISDVGRASLARIGVSVPDRESALLQVQSPVPCPFCGATETHRESAFGPTRCRMIYYCDACKNSFEHMKRV